MIDFIPFLFEFNYSNTCKGWLLPPFFECFIKYNNICEFFIIFTYEYLEIV